MVLTFFDGMFFNLGSFLAFQEECRSSRTFPSIFYLSIYRVRKQTGRGMVERPRGVCMFGKGKSKTNKDKSAIMSSPIERNKPP
jgi:hypothetical protein